MGCWTSFEPVRGLPIHLAATCLGLCKLSLRISTRRFLTELYFLEGESEWHESDDALLVEAKAELSAYFHRKLRRFRLPLDLRGTGFQKKVWEALLRIPYGTTASYAGVARSIGAPKAVRAVGNANGANPVAIIVPCHRVVAAGGGLGGYSGGLDVKRTLLALESGAAEQLPLHEAQ